MPGTENLPIYLCLSPTTGNSSESKKSSRLKQISEADESILSIGQNTLLTSPRYEVEPNSPRLIKIPEKFGTGNQSELKKSPRLKHIEENEKTTSEKALRRSLPQISAVKTERSPRKRSSTFCDHSPHQALVSLNSDSLALVKNKSLGRVRETQEILQRIHIRKEIIFAKNFLNTLESIPLLMKKTNQGQADHFLAETFQAIHSSTEHLDYITALNMKAKKHHVYFCLNDKGEMILFSELFESIKLKKSSEICKAEVDDILLERKRKKNDLNYDNLLNLSENEKSCYNILIKFHPNRTEAIPPLQFLNMYEKFVKTPRLLYLISLAIDSPNTSFLKKMRLLNFTQTLHKLKTSDCDTSEVNEAFNYVILACSKTKSPEIIQLCSEIELIFKSQKLSLKKHKTQCDSNESINKILNGNCGFAETEKFIEEITNDLKLISAFSIYNTMPQDLMNESEKYPASIFWNHLFSYVKQIYKTQIKETEDPSEIKAFKSNKFIQLFTTLAYTLIQKNEYWASNAIYCILDHFNLVEENKKTERTGRSTKNIRKRLSLSPVSTQKPKAAEKSDSYMEIFQRVEELKHLYSPLKSYKNMRELMTECCMKQTFFVPHLSSYSLMALKGLQYINLNPETQNDEMKASFEESLIFSELNTLLGDLRFHTEKACKEKRLYTDIQKKLYPEKIKIAHVPQIQISKTLT